MRLWSIHPRYLDSRGLVALWREGLLAQAVLAGKTRGYTRHPQLYRFRAHETPAALLCNYLHEVLKEATRRGYSFDASKLTPSVDTLRAPVTTGQLLFEWDHLRRKLASRDPAHLKAFARLSMPEVNDVFFVVEGPVEEWERVGDGVIPNRRTAHGAGPP